jgi:hypothetical protein
MFDGINRLISSFNLPVTDLAAWIRSAQMKGEKVTLPPGEVGATSNAMDLVTDFFAETVRMLEAGECKIDDQGAG